MSRYRAAGVHFLISLAIVSVLIILMYSLWYPGFYFNLMGGKKLIALIAGVDVFLGPLLTLIVFNAQKKSLKFDLVCIAIVQIVAMCYGLYVMFESRPVFTVFNKNAFQVVSVVDVTKNELANGKSEQWRTFSVTGPTVAAIGTPDKNNKEETMFAMVESAMAHRYPKLYDDYNKHVNEVIEVAKPLSDLEQQGNKNAVKDFLKEQNRPQSDFLYLPIISEVKTEYAIIDAKSGQIIDTMPLNIEQDHKKLTRD